ncbi:MAG: asparagine synthase-related protein [Pseudomonadota bacterium]|nr:asparagine synthase-related protein [Pseudomonadota bacterium]
MRLDHLDDLDVGFPAPMRPPKTGHADILLRAWDRWGIGALSRLEGDFAFCLWDERRQELTLARDALGLRALHYRQCGGSVAFASMPGQLTPLLDQTDADLALLTAYLCGVPELGHASFIRGIRRVRPGHAIVFVRNGGLREEQWWRPDLSPIRLSTRDAVEAMRCEFDRAVAAAIATDVPVLAAHLSGGLDSTLVVEAASRLLPSSSGLIAITGRIAGEGQLNRRAFEDAPLAKTTAASFPNVRHILAEAEPESPLDTIDRWMSAERPLRHPYNLNWLDSTYEAARAAGAKVLLCGDYGNATLSERGESRLQHLAMRFKWFELSRQIRAHRRQRGGSWPGLLATSFGALIPGPLWSLLLDTWGSGSALVADSAFLRRSSVQVRKAAATAASLGYSHHGSPSKHGWAKGRFLFMQDMDSAPMYHDVRRRFGLEIRDPTAARRVVELSLRLGPEHFYDRGGVRLLARRMLRGRVSDSVVDEQRKGLQATNWLASATIALDEFRRELDRIEAYPELAELIDTPALRRCLDEWPTEGWEDQQQMMLYRQRFTSTVALGRWARRINERRV